MSLRAVGEGHLSSIEFRTGVLDADAGVTIDDAGDAISSAAGGRRPATSTSARFSTKLLELGAVNDLSSSVLNRLSAQFTLEELEASLSALEAARPAARGLVRDGQDHSRARVVELRDHVSRRTRSSPSA